MPITVLVLALSCLSLLSPFAAACSLSFAVSGAFPPYHVPRGNGEWDGIGVDLFRQLAKQVDCSVEVIDIPWERALGLLASGELDATSNMSASDERQQFAYFIGPQRIEKIVAIVDSKLSAHLHKPIDLINFPGTIGKTQGTYYGKELEKIIASPEVQNRLVNITSNANRVGMMLAGRFDATLEEESVARHLYDIGVFNEPNQTMILDFTHNPVFFGLSRESVTPEMAKKFAQAWRNLVASHEIIHLYQRYGLSYTPLAMETHTIK